MNYISVLSLLCQRFDLTGIMLNFVNTMKEPVSKTLIIGPELAAEQFIAEHIFLYLSNGRLEGRYGENNYCLSSGECCILRKNQLGKYLNVHEAIKATKVTFIFDQPFLRTFQEKHGSLIKSNRFTDAFVKIASNDLLSTFIGSLNPYYDSDGRIGKSFFDLKREELLLILLQSRPELSGLFFDYGIPGKIDLELFMNQNYRFNVNLDRFAFLTGRSLSSFKRDFKQTYNDTPHRWLLKRRLTEARFLMEKEGKKPMEIFVDLGFEDLSHFCFAFKKHFGRSPNKLT